MAAQLCHDAVEPQLPRDHLIMHIARGASMSEGQSDDKTNALWAVATDVFEVGHKQGPMRTFLHLLRAPVRHTLEFVDDPAYTGHGRFFRLATYLYIVTTIVMTAALISFDPAAGSRGGFVHTMQELQSSKFMLVAPVLVYSGFILYLVVGYMILSRLAKSKRAPRAYVKLRCLSGGFATLLYLPLAGVTLAARLAMDHLPASTATEIWSRPATWVLAAAAVCIYGPVIYLLVYEVRIQKRFWGIGTGRTLIGCLLASAIVFPILVVLYTFLLNEKISANFLQ